MTVASDIKKMKIQGAKNIAIASLKHLKKYAGKPGFDSEAKRLLAARPTAVALHNAIDRLDEKTADAIENLIREIESDEEKIANAGQRVIKKHATIMTHCHASSVMAVLKKSRRCNVFATMTEPKKQGLLTAKELARSGKNVALIADSAIGYYMPMMDMILVGADAIRREGLVNKIGTLPLALTAYEYGKPLYVAASVLKLDNRDSIKIEMRPEAELCKKLSRVKRLNPAFDITPMKYITAFITESGIKKPKDIMEMLK